MLNPIMKKEKISVSYKDYERYSRHIIMEEINIEGQQRLKRSKIICVGAGGLNSTVLLYLTTCGVGTIGIIDDDTIEVSNLQRQIIYNTKNIKQPKVQAAKIRLDSINPNINIKTYNIKLSQNNIHNIFSDYDIVIDGTDNFQSRKIISEYCYKLHKIHIYGAIEKFTGHVSVFNYQNGPKYHDLYNNISYNGCNTTGVLNTIAGITGIIQATEAIKIITGIGFILNGYLLKINAIKLSFQKIKIKPKKIKKQNIEAISNINKLHKIKYISVHEIKLLELNGYKLIDIRSQIEFKIKRINYAINIPLKNLKKTKYIQYIKNKLQNKIIIIYCNNEIRSFIGSQILSSNKIKHYILKGGFNNK
uniref:Molybdopterin biosynthesis protein n=1 Tax=Calliarthron tuberculosum TaxID=48942 RepID=M4ITP7_CALTB|nr:molybdopterin biosynthesis protein [Calliarthron tuberculosum]AGA63796.1 molybdopterin biosynthesis protein [Calliarthron tuberculosum]